MSSHLTIPNVTTFEKALYMGINLEGILYGESGDVSFFVSCGLTSHLPGIELVLYFQTMRVFLARRREPHDSDTFYALFSTVMLFLITIWVSVNAANGQNMWLLDRNYPGGPTAYAHAYTSSVYNDFGGTAIFILQQMTDGLMVRPIVASG